MRQVCCFYTPQASGTPPPPSLPAVGASVLTLPQVAAGGADVDVVVRHAGRDAHVAHALEMHVRVGVAHLVAGGLPVVVLVVGQVVAADVALPDHPALLFAAAGDLHVAVAARLGLDV